VAPVTCILWQRYLCFDPGDPIRPNRDRFVVPEGHPSALLWPFRRLTGASLPVKIGRGCLVTHRLAVIGSSTG
jgi:transketolase